MCQCGSRVWQQGPAPSRTEKQSLRLYCWLAIRLTKVFQPAKNERKNGGDEEVIPKDPRGWVSGSVSFQVPTGDQHCLYALWNPRAISVPTPPTVSCFLAFFEPHMVLDPGMKPSDP